MKIFLRFNLNFCTFFLYTFIFQIFNVEGQPLDVCFNCIRLLEIAWKFRKQIQESNEFILKHFGKYNEEPAVKNESSNESIQNIETKENSVTDESEVEFKLQTKTHTMSNQSLEIIDEEIYEEYEAIEEFDVPYETTKTELFDHEIKENLTEEITEYDTDSIVEFENVDEDENISMIETFDIENSSKDETNIIEFENEIICNICDEKFLTLSELEQHSASHSDQSKEFKCEECGKEFGLRSVYVVHLRMHTGLRPHVCNICEKSFTHNGNLKVHMRSHTGERPFKCNLCNKSFTQVGNLQMHQKMHSGERNYGCNQCDKSFKTFSNLNEHLQTHSDKRPFVCSICNYGAYKMSSYKNHMRIHTGERPYSCAHCAKTFS